MKTILTVLLVATLLAGCGGGKPLPSSRLHQPAGDFSFVTPDGWFRAKLPGIPFIVVSGEADSGLEPNLFVEFVKPGSIGELSQELVETYRVSRQSYEIVRRSDFTTESGLSGIKITARRETGNALPAATFHYLVQDRDRVIAITATSASVVAEKYEPIFDASIQTFESER